MNIAVMIVGLMVQCINRMMTKLMECAALNVIYK